MVLKSALSIKSHCFSRFFAIGLSLLSLGKAQATSDSVHPMGSEEADAAAMTTEAASHGKDSEASKSRGQETHAPKTKADEKEEKSDANKPAEKATSLPPQENPLEHKSPSVVHGLSWFVGVFAVVAILVFLFT